MAGAKTQSGKVVVYYEKAPPPKVTVNAFRRRFNAFQVETRKAVSGKTSIKISKDMVLILGAPKDIHRFLVKASGEKVTVHIPETHISGDKGLIKSLKEDFGISYEMLARILRVSQKSVLRWVAGESSPLTSHQETLRQVSALRDRMLRLLRKDAIPRYLHAHNNVLGGVRPLDLLASGQTGKVLADLDSLEAGNFA